MVLRVGCVFAQLGQPIEGFFREGIDIDRVRCGGGRPRGEEVLRGLRVAGILSLAPSRVGLEQGITPYAKLLSPRAAGVGVGRYPDIDSAMARATRVARAYRPDTKLADLYAERFELYRTLIDSLGPTWSRMAAT